MATVNISPQAGHGGANTTVDGTVRILGQNSDWATIRALTSGTNYNTDSANWYLTQIIGSGTAGKYAQLCRTFFHFDFGTVIPAGATITAAVFYFYPTYSSDGLSIGANNASKVVLCKSTTAADNDFVNDDFNNWEDTDFGRSAQQNSLTLNSYNSITVTAAGITYLNTVVAGIAKLCARFAFDLDNDVSALPAGATVGDQEIQCNFADAGGVTLPYLEITYTLPNITINCPVGALTLGTLVPTTIGNIFISAVTGTLSLTGYVANLITTGWKYVTKSVSTFTNPTKHTSTFTNKTKNSSSWTNKTKH